MLSAARARRVEGNAFLACRDIKTLSMWNAPSDRDYYDPFGAYCDEHEAEVCVDCGARWDSGEVCENWCEINRPVPEPVPASWPAVEEEEVTLLYSVARVLKMPAPQA